jgi:hypothetical protein
MAPTSARPVPRRGGPFHGLGFARGAGSLMRPRANLRRAPDGVRRTFRDIVQAHGRQMAKAGASDGVPRAQAASAF